MHTASRSAGNTVSLLQFLRMLEKGKVLFTLFPE